MRKSALCEHLPYANNKGADHSAHPRSLISTFIIHWLVIIIPILAKSKFVRCLIAAKAVLSLTWSQTPEDWFSHDVAQMVPYIAIIKICYA